MRRYGRRRRSKAPVFIFLLLVMAAVAGGFIYLSPKFERTGPEIDAPKEMFWNKDKSINITLKDNVGIKDYQVTLSDGNRQVVVASGSFAIPPKDTMITVNIPEKTGLNKSKSFWTMTITVTDTSMWNLLRGNRASKTVKLLVDTVPPVVGIVSNSPSIVQGGSGLVVFHASDKNLKDVYVEAGGVKFEVLPYKKRGFYATLVAWPFRVKDFSANVIAEDRAGNRKIVSIPFELMPKRYKVSWIGLSDGFLNGKIKEVASTDPDIPHYGSKLKIFKAVNEDMRKKNEKLIHTHTRKPTPVNYDKWRLRAFYPLKGAKVVAYFGDERHYYYKDKRKEVSHSWHLGYDLASVSHAPIYSSNKGTVVFAGYNGIYGNMPIIDHGFGLYTLYGHCSSVFVNEGDKVKAGEVVAKTGKTGLALGDHLHFGMLVQGVEVWPMDWMKRNWIKSHIDRVFKEADRVIRSR